jgi:cell division septum initiation protein DivIVA
MKKLLTALVVTLSTAAMAEQAGTTQAQQDQQRPTGRHISTGVDASEVGPTISNKAKDVGHSINGNAQEAREDVKEVASDTRQATTDKAQEIKQDASSTADRLANKAGLATASQGTFKKDKAFSANGILKNTGGGGVTLVRPGLPDANLDVRQETIVMLDGKKVDSSAIPEGAQVRARFQLEGEEIVAVEINATSPKGVKSTKAPVNPSNTQMDTTGTQTIPQQ